jgi:allophanate hydrolase subunit 1
MIKSGTGPTADHRNDLVLVKINRVEGDRHTSVTTWAKPLGDDLYEIRRPLDLITGFDVGDVVRAVSEETIPLVIELVQRGGYRTLHVAFAKGVAVARQRTVLNELKKWHATHEMAFDRFYTIVVFPQGNYEAICEYLKTLVRASVLRYEPDVDINTLARMHFLE